MERHLSRLWLLGAALGLASLPAPAAAQATHRDSVDVAHYELHVDFTRMSANRLSGLARVTFAPLAGPMASVGLDLQRLDVDSVTLGGAPLPFAHDGHVLRAWLPQPAAPGDTLTVEIRYQGMPPKDPSGWGGFYFAGGQAFNLGVGMTVDPHPYGRCWFPCVDNFTDKATYDIHATTLPQHRATCGGVLVADTLDASGNRVSRWRLDFPTPTYLASVAVGDFERVDIEGARVPVHVYCAPSAAGAAAAAFAAVPSMIDAFERWYGPYPYPRAGYTVVNFQSGAMEHLMNIAYPSNAVGADLASRCLMAHELSHFWLGGAVTCATAGDMWMNEGWASYSESLFVEEVQGTAAARAYDIDNHASVLQKAHVDDGGFLALAGVDHGNTYGSTVYNKGADVVRTLRAYMGDADFGAAARDWFALNPFAARTTDQLRDFFDARTDLEISAFFDTWVYQPGFPHYWVEALEPAGGGDVRVVVRQRRLGGDFAGQANRVPVTFWASAADTATRLVCFDGDRGEATFQLPFEPLGAVADFGATLADATLKAQAVVADASVALPHVNATLYPYPGQTPDSVWAHVTYHCLANPDAGTMVDGLEITPLHHWSVALASYGQSRVRGRFAYRRPNNPADAPWTAQPGDQLELLHRPAPGAPWRRVDTHGTLSFTGGNVDVDSLAPGDYAIGVRREPAGVETSAEAAAWVWPNPARGRISVAAPAGGNARVAVFDIAGREAYRGDIAADGIGEIDMTNWNAGVYVAVLTQPGAAPRRELIVVNE